MTCEPTQGERRLLHTLAKRTPVSVRESLVLINSNITADMSDKHKKEQMKVTIVTVCRLAVVPGYFAVSPLGTGILSLVNFVHSVFSVLPCLQNF